MSFDSSVVPASDSSPALRALVALAGRNRWQGVARGVVLGGALYEGGRKAWRSAVDNLGYTVTVDGRDEAFDAVNAWLLERIPPARRRSLTASTGRPSHGNSPAPVPDDGRHSYNEGRDVRVRYDGTRPVRATIGGASVRVQVHEERVGGGRDGEGILVDRRVVFTAATMEGRDAVLALLGELAKSTAPGPRLYVASKWGSWSRASESPSRPLSSIVLRSGQLERIVDDLARFLALEADYVRLGLPWHHGFLFHGPPGSGKSSAARAVAAAAGLDVYYLPLSDVRADADLHEMLASIGRAALVVEDVDVVHAAKARDDDGKGVSMSGLLNVLDGLATPHGLVTFMTTNDVDSIDKAVIRPGRCDLREFFDVVDADQFTRLWRAMTGRAGVPSRAAEQAAEKRWTPADVLDVIKPHIGDPAAAEASLLERLKV